jgi:hypothetical protein
MAKPYDTWMGNQGLGSDQNGNQIKYPDPNNPWGNSLGSYQQPQGGISAGQIGNWIGSWGQQPSYANNISGSKSFGFAPTQPQVSSGISWSNPVQNNGFGQYNPQSPNGSWQQISQQSQQNAEKRKMLLSNGPAFSQVPKPVQYSRGYETLSQNTSYQKAQSNTYNNKTYVSYPNAHTNPLANSRNLMGSSSQKANDLAKTAKEDAAYKMQLNKAYTGYAAYLALLSKPTTVPANTGGGYGYDYGYGYGGGGYSQRKYAENLPGAVWRMNQ